MTIDETIQKARNNENIFKNNHKLNLTLKKRSPYYGLDCLKISEDNKHLAEWLEELKAYRENEGMSENVYRCGYNKGVNDFADLISRKSHIDLDEDYVDGGSTVITTGEVFEIAEQLKGAK